MMARFLGLDELFEGRHFDRQVIFLCVRWYLRFKLSYRDPVEMIVPVRIVRPRNASVPLPAVMYIHGGGGSERTAGVSSPSEPGRAVLVQIRLGPSPVP
jgi:hypothetical protein